ncbi:hypothetical protein KW801_03130 [Candidatus Saccharibacteria bacterium]|nr:hypothetical protein [Candidatus Saccharibacteria bacterium]
MSPFLVSFLVTAGVTTWIYLKFQKYSGNNTKQSTMAASAAGIFIFIVFYFIANSILK